MAFDRNRHVVAANGEAWIQIDALVELLASASSEFISRSKRIGGDQTEAVGVGAAYVCSELRLQLIKLSIIP